MSRLAAFALAALLMGASVVLSSPSPASAFPLRTVDFVGHGWGHGRGMGQYGAYGYALAGEPYSWILDHFYGGTTLGSVPASTALSVHIAALDGADTIAQMTDAHLLVSWNGGSLGPQAGVRVVHNPGATLSVFTGGGCGGPWSPAAVNLARTDVTIAPQVPGDSIAEMVQACPPDGSRHWYRGSIVAKTAIVQTWGSVALDDYVRGVVPRESPASWGTSGGEEALRAQAVAARSYGLAYARAAGVVCDTSACQAYGGRAVANSSGYQDLEGAGVYLTTTDAAVASTAGQVRICAGSTGCPMGTVAHTEFSSSTGGYSAGGAFPPVADDGDATASNASHSWAASVPATSVEAAFGSIGSLLAVTVTQRNGLGDLGGRALLVQVSGSSGAVVVSGDQLASALGLRSDWFAVTNATTGPSGGDDGYWIVGNDGGIFTFGAAGFYGSTGATHLNQPIDAMAPTPTRLGYWLVASDGGIFSFGDARFYGSTGALRLSRPVVGMAATPSGRGYWLVASDGGIFSFGDARFYGSTGALRLNRPVVGMAATPSGGGYWLIASDGGIFSFGDAHFEGSLPGRGITDAIAAAQQTADGAGYVLVGASGAIYSFGDAPWYGGMPQLVSGYRGTITGLAVRPGG